MSSRSKPVVLFICQHDAGRSQSGAALLEHLASDCFTATSAGLAPSDAPAVAATVAELGIDITAADVVVLMKPGLILPVTPRARSWSGRSRALQPGTSTPCARCGKLWLSRFRTSLLTTPATFPSSTSACLTHIRSDSKARSLRQAQSASETGRRLLDHQIVRPGVKSLAQNV
ncbi:hypothetical protein ABMA10_00630 [Plantibacter sp. RU18]